VQTLDHVQHLRMGVTGQVDPETQRLSLAAAISIRECVVMRAIGRDPGRAGFSVLPSW